MRHIFLSRTFFIIIILAGLFLVGFLIIGGYYGFHILQIKSITALEWEDDRYLWGTGASGIIRWDVNQEAIVYSSFKPDRVDQFFISKAGQVWGYGQGIWRFEAGNWIERSVGLSRGKIHDMIQTKDGTIWVATWHGFKTWNENRHIWESTAINQSVQTLVEGSDGTLWFGLVEDGVIQKQSSGEVVNWTVSEGLVDNHIVSMLIASDGMVWVGTRDGASRWDGESWQGWYDFGALDPDGLVVYKLYETSDGNIWAATSESLAMWNGTHWTAYREPFCLTNRTLLETSDGSLWAGCPSGLFRWNGSNWHEYGAAEGIRDNSFANLLQGGNGVLYAHTKSGLYQYISQQDRWQPFLNQQSLLGRLIFFQ